MSNDQKILKEISEIDEQIKVLLEKKKYLVQQLTSLSCKIVVLKNIDTSLRAGSEQNSNKLSVEEKISLFRNLFKGRDDVYPRYWLSKKTGKSGYSPTCKNEWVNSICKKPAIKCSECPNRKLELLTDDVIYKHLNGEHIVGVYPLLPNGNCHFLAIDFDGTGWTEDILAFRKICSEEKVPIAVERSRSGNGAHVWIFFNEEVSAISARKLGSFLITKTMENRYQLDMKSYDRLFPNQDTMPKGGFGNLIALPMQKEALKAGNSAFIDDNYIPYQDQWLFLSNVPKLSASDVELIAQEATRTGQVIGVRPAPVNEDDPPWMWLPSGKKQCKPEIINIPKEIELVMANRIYIKTDSLPSALLTQLKRLAAFQNPEFYRRQSMRLSTAITPRVISCAEIVDGYLSLPRGCIDDISCVLKEYGINIHIKDERLDGKQSKFEFYGALDRKQESILREILKQDVGILVAPPGIGKTVIAIATIAKRKTNTLVLVHRKPLMEQWKIQLATLLNRDLQDIGEIGASKNSRNGVLDIAMIQSLEKMGVVKDIVAEYGFVIVDECHHVSAVSFERVLTQVKAKYVLGLTATPYRKDGHQPIIHMQCGPISCLIKHSEMQSEKYDYRLIPRVTSFAFQWTEESKIHELWPKLLNDKERNKMIVDDILTVINEKRFPLILTERREHLAHIESMLNGNIDYLAVLHGGIHIKKRQKIIEELRSIPDNQTKALLATGSYIGEGFDEPRLDTLFIVMPISFKGRIVQYVGRLHREHPGKNEIRIYDYIDNNVPVLNAMFRKRLKVYQSLGYKESDLWQK